MENEISNLKPVSPQELNRSDRRKKLKFLKEELKKHNKKKPSVDIEEVDEDKQEARIMEIQRWATHTGVLMRKIQELDEFKRNNKRSNK